MAAVGRGIEDNILGSALDTALKLGRVSNLPTVWSNVLAGMVMLAALVAAPSFGGVGLVCALVALGAAHEVLPGHGHRVIDHPECSQRIRAFVETV